MFTPYKYDADNDYIPTTSVKETAIGVAGVSSHEWYVEKEMIERQKNIHGQSFLPSR